MQQEIHATSIPLEQISIQPDFNPRRHRTDGGMSELIESVKAEGVIQSIVVRPNGSDGYFVVAGERRFRAALEAGLPAIPSLVRDLDDAEALAVATVENGVREDISIAEEARLVQRAVGACDGDRQEAARLLGWKRSRVDARLMLLHADDVVLDALEQRQINVGHAELLAGVPKVTQRGTLTKIIEDGITVADLKGKLGQFTRELSHARFDTSGCQGCPFNSSTQSSLFEFSVGEGRCSNHECWSQKNEDHVQKVKAEQAESFPVIFFDRERDTTRRTMLMKDGEKGVGDEQYRACQSCKHFGAVVSTEPGREGIVTEDVCFNVTCNAKMVKAHVKATAETDSEDAAATQKGGGSQATNRSAPTATAKTKTNAGSPKAVIDKAKAFVRDQSVREHQSDSRLSDAMSLYGMLQLAGVGRDEDVRKELLTVRELDVMQMTGATLFEVLLVASDQQRYKLRHLAMTKLLTKDTYVGANFDTQGMAKAVCVHMTSDLVSHFKLNRDYLKAHTKSGMKALLEDAGYDQWYDKAKGKGAFGKLMKAKVDVILDTVFPENDGYDFSGFVPTDVINQAGIAAGAKEGK